MRRVKLKWLAVCALVVLSAAVAVPVTQANPPIAGATFAGKTSEGLDIVLVVNEAGNELTADSYIDFTCGTNLPTRHYLGGTSVHIPSGVTNRSGMGVTNAVGPPTRGFEDGTLSWRFFARFFASSSGGAGGQMQPPGDAATGDFSGRNVTGIPGGVGFCSFRVTWTAVTPPPDEGLAPTAFTLAT